MPSRARWLALFAGITTAALAQGTGLSGYWRTPGGAVIQFAPCSSAVSTLCARLVQLEPNPPSRVDSNNPDATQRARPLCGLEIGSGFVPSGPDRAEDGHLYDPKTGKTYRGSLASSGDRLLLRGYIGIKAFGRTEQWTRTTPLAACH